MDAQQIGSVIKITRVKNAVAAGQTTQESSFVDMANWQGVLFLLLFGTLTSGHTMTTELEESAASNGGTPSDIAGSGYTVPDGASNQIVAYDLYRPADVPTTGRYVGVLIERGTQNTVIDGVVAIQYGPRKMPQADDATTVATRVRLIQPIAGTE